MSSNGFLKFRMVVSFVISVAFTLAGLIALKNPASVDHVVTDRAGDILCILVGVGFWIDFKRTKERLRLRKLT